MKILTILEEHSMATCTACGRQQSSEDKFCAFCGAQVIKHGRSNPVLKIILGTVGVILVAGVAIPAMLSLGKARAGLRSPEGVATFESRPSSWSNILPFHAGFGDSPDRITGLTPLSQYGTTGQHTISQEYIAREFTVGEWAGLQWYFKFTGQHWAAADHEECFFGFKENKLVIVLIKFNSEERFHGLRGTITGSNKLRSALLDQHNDPYISGATWGSLGDAVTVRYVLKKPRGEDLLAYVVFATEGVSMYRDDKRSLENALGAHP
jgi:hypothetical protein